MFSIEYQKIYNVLNGKYSHMKIRIISETLSLKSCKFSKGAKNANLYTQQDKLFFLLFHTGGYSVFINNNDNTTAGLILQCQTCHHIQGRSNLRGCEIIHLSGCLCVAL